MHHNVKTWPEHFERVLKLEKPFEIRLNDRDFKTGDTITHQEFDPDLQAYTGRSFGPLRIGLVYTATDYPTGIKPGYCVFAQSLME
jgi:hypothetical protein